MIVAEVGRGEYFGALDKKFCQWCRRYKKVVVAEPFVLENPKMNVGQKK